MKTRKDNVYLPSSSRGEIGSQENYSAGNQHRGHAQSGAPLDSTVSNNTTVVNDGRPSGDGGRMHLLGSHTNDKGVAKEHQPYQQDNQFDGSRHNIGQDGDQHGSGNPLLNRTMDDGTSIKEAYLNPAFYKDQPTLWLPRDQLGLSAEQVSKARSHGVDITDEDATIDQKAKIEIQRDTLPGQDFDP